MEPLGSERHRWAGPSANLGDASGEATIENDTAVFVPEDVGDCKLTMTFLPSGKLKVEQQGEECGFGHVPPSAQVNLVLRDKKRITVWLRACVCMSQMKKRRSFSWTELSRELKRRHIYTVVATYAVVSWVLLQIGEVTFGPLHIPEWVMSRLVVLVIIGFPIVVVLAWFFDLTARESASHRN
jgi:hypothetical protein